EPAERYGGYASCPLTTARDKMLLAEFDYTNRPAPSSPGIDTTRERNDIWYLKRYGLPFMYSSLLLKGLAAALMVRVPEVHRAAGDELPLDRLLIQRARRRPLRRAGERAAQSPRDRRQAQHAHRSDDRETARVRQDRGEGGEDRRQQEPEIGEGVVHAGDPGELPWRGEGLRDDQARHDAHPVGRAEQR